jgi:drug/metabolite transporter (DMT)-like permease
MKQSAKATAALMLALSLFSWAQAPVFIRFLREAYGPFAMTFIRYGSGAVALTVVCLIYYRAEFLRLLRHPAPILGIALLNVIQQTTWTTALYGATATMAQVVTKLDLVFVIAFSYFLFHEERKVIRSPLYMLGTALSLLGVVAVLTKDAGSLVPVLDRWAVLLLITTVLWGTYRVWSKHIVMRWHPIPMFAVLAIYTTLGFFVLTLGSGQAGDLIHAGPKLTGIALFSGIMPIAVAHPSFNFAQKHLGSAFCTSLGLLVPFMTYMLAVLVLPAQEETLLPSQWVGVIVLISGAFLVIWAGQRVHGAQKTGTDVGEPD